MSTTQEAGTVEVLRDAEARIAALETAEPPGPIKTALQAALTRARAALKTMLIVLRERAQNDQAAIP